MRFLKKLNLKCSSGATAIEYGLISSLIAGAVLASTWESGQELSNNMNVVANTLGDNRQDMLNEFYDLTSEANRCNGFGSCGHQGNQGVWEGFKDIALSNDAFDDLLIDRDTFERGIFREARNRTYQEMGLSSWRRADQTAARQTAQNVWLELAAERTPSE